MRWLFLLATIPGCLWIDAAEHEERKRSIDPELVLLDITPGTWSACAGPPTFTVVAEVAVRHVGRTFETWYEVDGERSVSGTATAGQDGSLVFDVSPGEVAPGCADTCPVTFTVGVSHLGFDDQVDVDVAILGETDPTIAQAALVADDGTLADLATLVPDANPAGSVQQEQWPALAVGIVDPYLREPGSDLAVQLALCPEGTSPGDVACVVQDAERSEHVLTGDAVYEVPTEALAAAACADGQRGLQWDAYVLLGDHPCASSGEIAVGTPLRLVLPDCDADLFTVADGDCDDDDPALHPDATETWYDGVDQDCDGADDFDRDGDGSLGGKNGADCDDDDPMSYPGAAEICDDADNDCDGAQLEGVVTVESGASVDQHPTLDDALSAANAGDTVRVCPGVFTGTFVIDEDLTVIGSGAGDTVLQPAAADQPVVDVVGAVTVRLEGLEISGATDTLGTLRGGGVRSPVADLTVVDSRIVGNSAFAGGGLLVGRVALLDGVLISGNSATTGGGVYVEIGTDVTLLGADVSGNGAVEGGGVALTDDAVLTMDAASRVHGNTATRGGGLLMLDDCEVYGGEILANVATDGGGVFARVQRDNVPAPYLEGVRIADHTGISRGGAISAAGDGIELAVFDCVLEDNSALDDGGAIAVVSGGQDGAVLWFEQTDILGNTAGGDGGGVHAENSFLYGYDSTVDGNQATRGGGIYADLFVGELACTLSNNVALTDGGGLYGVEGVVFNVTDPLQLTGNQAQQGGGAYLDNTWLVAPDAVVTGNSATGLGGACFLTNDGYALWTGAGTVSGNASLSGESDGGWVSATGDALVSCSTVSFADTVGTSGTPAAGVPASSCFSAYPTHVDVGSCAYCP